MWTGTNLAASKVDQKQPLQKIGEALGANMVIMGTMQGSGDKIRIILKLEDVVNNKELWSQQFDGVTGDLFTLEDEIYNPLRLAMNVTPTNDERANAGVHATENIAAYDLYLKGQNAMRGQQDLKNVDAAMNFYQDALKSDAGFALAYAGLSEAGVVMFGKNIPSRAQKAIKARCAQFAYQLLARPQPMMVSAQQQRDDCGFRLSLVVFVARLVCARSPA